VEVDDTAKRAAEIESKLAKSPAAPPGMSTNRENEGRLGFESGRSDYQVNYSFIYPAAAEVSPDFQKSIGWTRYPRTDKDKPSRPPLGGLNIAVSKFSRHPDLAFEAAECLASPEHQALNAELGGLPPTTTSVYDDPKVKKAFPFADELRASIDAAGPRPVTPAYSDIALAIQKTYHPPDAVDPNGIVGRLRDRIEKAVEGKIF
jgi:multiple sugar transport system substrate-binding protein